MIAAGAPAPPFTLRDRVGNTRSLKAILERGPALLALYKVSCPVCQLAAPYLERLSNGSLQVVTVSQDNSAATQKFEQTYGLTAPSLLDPQEDGYKLSNALGIDHVPSLFLVEQDGTISLASSGFSKTQLEQLGARAGVQVFRQGENVPEWKAG
jgi:peroxiredoxin